MVQKKTTATRTRKKTTTATKARKTATVKKQASVKRAKSATSTSKARKSSAVRAKKIASSQGQKRVKRTRESLPVSYQSFEKELNRFSELLESVGLRGRLVKKSLAYIEKEQKRLNQQLLEAKRFLPRLKNRSLKVWRDFPEHAEEVFRQLKLEFNRFSQRLGLAL